MVSTLSIMVRQREARGYGRASIGIGRFEVVFTVRTHIPILQDIKDDSEVYCYDDSHGSEIEIYDVNPLNTSANPLDDLVSYAGSSKLDFAHIACFGPQSAPATFDNIATAIQWCKMNQDFSKDFSGSK